VADEDVEQAVARAGDEALAVGREVEQAAVVAGCDGQLD
jgi:hypothetical protein